MYRTIRNNIVLTGLAAKLLTLSAEGCGFDFHPGLTFGPEFAITRGHPGTVRLPLLTGPTIAPLRKDAGGEHIAPATLLFYVSGVGHLLRHPPLALSAVFLCEITVSQKETISAQDLSLSSIARTTLESERSAPTPKAAPSLWRCNSRKFVHIYIRLFSF